MPFMERLYSSLILKTPMYDPMHAEIIEHKSDAFYNAVRADDTPAVIRMIEEGFDVDHHVFGHPPPLIFAIVSERHAIVQTLLLYGADPNLADRSGDSALHYAVKLRQPQNVLQLLRYGADPMQKGKEDLTPLEIAKTFHDTAVAALLKETRPLVEEIGINTDRFKLAAAGNLHALVHTRPTAAQLREKDDRRRTLLHHAVFGNNPKLIIWLLNKSLDIDSADLHGITPLIIAASHPKFINVLNILIARNATLEHRTNNQATALTLALRNGNAEGAKCLIENGANILCVDGPHTPLSLVHRAIERYPEAADGFRDIQTMLLDRGAHCDIATNRSGWTPLFHAAARRQDEEDKAHLRLLLQLGSDVNRQDRNGRTPLMVAASMGRRYAVEILLKNYAEIDRIDRYGWSALMLAVYYNHIRIVEFLLQCGCDANLTSAQGLNAMKVARKHQRRQIITLLRQYGAEATSGEIEEEDG